MFSQKRKSIDINEHACQILKEIQDNRNHSWFREVIRDNNLSDQVFDRLESGISKEAFEREFDMFSPIVFRYMVENSITKNEFIYESFQFARVLRSVGICKGTEFSVFMDRTPEYTYLLGGANIVAAKINVVCERFSLDYIKNVILKNCTSKVVFLQDNKLPKLEKLIYDLPEYMFVVVPVLKSAHKRKVYDKYIKKYYPVDDAFTANMIRTRDNVCAYEEVYANRIAFEGKIEEPADLDTIFTVSYSSGTTGNPKGIVHSNRHYITMGRYHDPEVSGVPEMGNLSTYSNIPSYSNSFILSSVSDNLIKTGLVMLDPVDVSEYFPVGLKINKGNMNIASAASWNILALNYFYNPKYKNYRIENAILNFAAGEGYSASEEYLGNRFLKAAHAGRRIKIAKNKEIRLPFGLAMMSIAGGQCEIGSIFIRIHRALFSKNPRRKQKKDPIGMSTYDFVDIKVLREDGTYANPYEIGRMTALSDCNMQYYNHDEISTNNFYITDAYGIRRADMKDYGYVDEKGNVVIKDRIRDTLEKQLEFRIEDAISRDYKHIAVVKVVKTEENVYAAHIILQPKTRIDMKRLKSGIKNRVNVEVGNAFQLYIKIMDGKSYYPLTKSLKVDKSALTREGIAGMEKLI